jgi:hypothetical protein
MESTTLSLEEVKATLKSSFAQAGFSRQNKTGEKFIWYKQGIMVDNYSAESVAALASKFIACADLTIAECAIRGVERKHAFLDISDDNFGEKRFECELRIPASPQ